MIWEIDEKKVVIEGLDAAGRPDPAYAAALGLLQAPSGRRAVAGVCDLVGWLLLQLPLWLGAVPLLLKLAGGSISPYGFINHPGFVLAVVMAAVSVVFSLVYCVVQLVMHGLRGMTIGKAITGIRTVDVRTLERPGFGRVLLRSLILLAASLVPLLLPVFLASPLFDAARRGRGWHDRATGVWLIDVRGGLDPFDEKRLRVARKMVKAAPAAERAVLPSLATPSDSRAQPEYRPGSRISAGVLGVARPHSANERPAVGLSQATAPVPPASTDAGRPVLGGFRPAGPTPSAPARAPLADQGLVADVPVTPSPVPPQIPPVQESRPQPTASPVRNPTVQPGPTAQPESAPQSAAAQASASAGVPPVRASAPAVRYALRLDSGESILVAGPVLLGRNPDATPHPGARAIPLADASRSLSKTHMLVRPVPGGVAIVDCGSTNGSGLFHDGVEYSVTAGTPAMAVEGDTIRLGDRRATVVRV